MERAVSTGSIKARQRLCLGVIALWILNITATTLQHLPCYPIEMFLMHIGHHITSAALGLWSCWMCVVLVY